MPAYNAANYIANAIYSVLEQEGIQPDELELIVINDASTDTTDDVMKRFTNDARITYLVNERNLGVADSRNRAIDLAGGSFIAFLDADDWWEPDKLAAQLEALDETKAPICCTGRSLHKPDGTPTGRVIGVPRRITYEMLLKTNSIPCGSVVMRSDLAKQYHMTHSELHEDYILWLQVLKNHGAAVGINEPYLHCRLSEGGKSRNKLKSARMHYGVYRYLGFGRIQSIRYFISYALNGVKKYYGKSSE